MWGLLRLLLLDLLYLPHDEYLLVYLLEPHVRHPRDLPLLLGGQPGQAIRGVLHLHVDGAHHPGLRLGSDHLAAVFAAAGDEGKGRFPLD